MKLESYTVNGFQLQPFVKHDGTKWKRMSIHIKPVIDGKPQDTAKVVSSTHTLFAQIKWRLIDGTWNLDPERRFHRILNRAIEIAESQPPPDETTDNLESAIHGKKKNLK